MIVGTPKPDSKLYEVGELIIWHSRQTATLCLQNFKGHYLRMRNTECHNTDLIEFLKKWISGEDHLNIEAVFLTSTIEMEFNPENIMVEFKTMRWDKKRRPREYVYKKGNSNVWETPTDCADFLDVERKTDGKLASFYVTHKSFTFLVWT
uniref:FBA_2 domain-containing protein n=1 Tax=Caenorhabditis tropicalis TaxID=1561998 RepID=A0A1I7UX14_9PELO